MSSHNELGKTGELIAARHLIGLGYVILASDYRVGHRDIDIVAAKDGTTVFVEVKTRATDKFGNPEEAVTDVKMRNIVYAANKYIWQHNVRGPVRFDVISVVGTSEPYRIKHFLDAFNPYSLQYSHRSQSKSYTFKL